MPSLRVDSFQFDFLSTVAAEKYDDWQHWRTQSGKKKVDVVAVEPVSSPTCTWLIEARDFRVISGPPKPSKIGSLHRIVAQKMHDTLDGLNHACRHAGSAEKAHANAAILAPSKRVVFHLEPHVATGDHSKLFPKNFAANVYQAIRPLVAEIDANPLVLNISNTPLAGVPWRVS
jgi:hypothetical protein